MAVERGFLSLVVRAKSGALKPVVGNALTALLVGALDASVRNVLRWQQMGFRPVLSMRGTESGVRAKQSAGLFFLSVSLR